MHISDTLAPVAKRVSSTATSRSAQFLEYSVRQNFSEPYAEARIALIILNGIVLGSIIGSRNDVSILSNGFMSMMSCTIR